MMCLMKKITYLKDLKRNEDLLYHKNKFYLEKNFLIEGVNFWHPQTGLANG